MRLKWFGVALFFVFTFARAEDASKKLVISKDEQVIIDDTNAVRKKAGLPVLKPNPLLFVAARKHSADMAKEKVLEHHLHDKGPQDRIEATGYKAMAGRENIACNHASIKDVVDGWMHSEGHKENILADDILEIGVGIANDSDGHPYYTQVFGLSESSAITVKFSIRNATKKELTLNLGGDKPAIVKPGENSTYAIYGALETQSVDIQADDLTKKAKVKTGSKLSVEIKDGALQVQGEAK